MVLRLIPKDWFKAKKPVPFGRIAFEPHTEDVDGISLYRERWVSAIRLDASRPKSGNFYVGRLKVRDIYGQGLTLVRNVGVLPGHVVIPELSIEAYPRNKQKLNEIVVKLCTFAGQDIVLEPRSLNK